METLRPEVIEAYWDKVWVRTGVSQPLSLHCHKLESESALAACALQVWGKPWETDQDPREGEGSRYPGTVRCHLLSLSKSK